MSATKNTKELAKSKGIRVTYVVDGKRKNKSESQLLAELKDASHRPPIRRITKNPPYTVMTLRALKGMHTIKGISTQAIDKYVRAHYPLNCDMYGTDPKENEKIHKRIRRNIRSALNILLDLEMVRKTKPTSLSYVITPKGRKWLEKWKTGTPLPKN